MSLFSLARSRRLRGAAIAGVATAALAMGIPQVGSAAAGHGASASRPAAAAASGLPTFVHLPADQAAHPGAAFEWWYTVGQVSSRGHKYAYEVQLTNSGAAQLSITDITARKYYTRTLVYKAGQFSESATKLDVRMPDATLSGPMNAMRLTATLPQGSLNLLLDAEGPVLYDNGTGLFPFLGGSSYYYSLPRLSTSGTLTLDGKTSRVTGESWLDRQWGSWDWTKLHRWTWMAIQLSNGDAIDLWDLFDTQGEEHWATVLYPNGTESVVSVKPLAKQAGDFQTSPVTGQRYAGQWTVEIPGLPARLTVTATPVLQEILPLTPPSQGIDEAASLVAGTYQGTQVTGQARVEQFGRWK